MQLSAPLNKATTNKSVSIQVDLGSSIIRQGVCPLTGIRQEASQRILCTRINLHVSLWYHVHSVLRESCCFEIYIIHDSFPSYKLAL